ncbi:MAG: DNA pilot protein [Microvirus sp.]|nr:MAG: DNA pilot protein [Microvirus sp.]
MPIPLAGLAALSAAGGSAVNSLSTLGTNFMQQRFSRKMYDLQKNDNLAFWHLQNQYNSPEQQMQRLKDAGLNPNLVYGQSSGAASGQAQQVQTPDVQNVQFRSPEFGNIASAGGLAYINSIYDLDIKQAQIDNLRAQNDVIKQDALLKSAYTNRSKFDLEFEGDLRNVSAESRRERLRQLKTSTDISIDSNIRQALQTTSNLTEAAERIATMKQHQLSLEQQRSQSRMETSRIAIEKRRLEDAIQGIRRDNILKDLEIDLRKQGINPNDPMWSRIAGRILSDLFSDSDTPSVLDFFKQSKFR